MVSLGGRARSSQPRPRPPWRQSIKRADTAVARECLSLRKALDELALLCADFPIQGPLIVFCDNKAALSLCNDRKEGQRAKHIDIIHHFARDHVASGESKFVYCRSASNVSDCLTKALPHAALESSLVGLGMLVS